MQEPDFRNLIERAPDTIILFDRNGRYLYVSPAIREATGGLLSPEILMGRTLAEFGFSAELVSLSEAARERILATGKDDSFSFAYDTPHGERHFQVALKPEQTTDGHVETILAVVRDVTSLKNLEDQLRKAKLRAETQAQMLRHSGKALERLYIEVEKRVGARTVALEAEIAERKRAEEALARREEEYRTVAENTPDPIVRYDRELRRSYVNPALAHIHQKPASELLGARLSHDILDDASLKSYEKALRSVLDSGQPLTFETRWMVRGEGRYYQFRMAPEFSEDGRVESVLAVGRDITELKGLEEALRRAKEEADAANRAKSVFLANMSHEIRTPLYSIMSVLELAPMLGVSEEVRSYIQIADQSARHLMGLLNNLLDLSKIESGTLALGSTSFDPRLMLGSIAKPMAVLAKAKGIALNEYVDPLIPARLVGDELRLRQILLNLVGNAIKYTDQGGIEIAVRLAQEPPQCSGRIHLLFTVRDTGVGIPRDKHEAVFQGLIQSGAGQPTDSSGLGLQISRQLVGLMGGRIWFESEPGRGSTFSFTVELRTAERVEDGNGDGSASIQAATAKPLRILLAEDNLINQMLTAEILTRMGHEVATASNGREVLERMRAGRFDVVLMDISMPEVDGLQATRLIRQGYVEEASIHIIAMTAFAQEGDCERMLLEGMDDYIAKPFAYAELKRKLEKVRRRDG